jgi:hypothetical protein
MADINPPCIYSRRHSPKTPERVVGKKESACPMTDFWSLRNEVLTTLRDWGSGANHFAYRPLAGRPIYHSLYCQGRDEKHVAAGYGHDFAKVDLEAFFTSVPTHYLEIPEETHLLLTV